MLGGCVSLQLSRGIGGNGCLLNALDVSIQPGKLAVSGNPRCVQAIGQRLVTRFDDQGFPGGVQLFR
jgi:hypothetical protein